MNFRTIFAATIIAASFNAQAVTDEQIAACEQFLWNAGTPMQKAVKKCSKPSYVEILHDEIQHAECTMNEMINGASANGADQACR